MFSWFGTREPRIFGPTTKTHLPQWRLFSPFFFARTGSPSNSTSPNRMPFVSLGTGHLQTCLRACVRCPPEPPGEGGGAFGPSLRFGGKDRRQPAKGHELQRPAAASRPGAFLCVRLNPMGRRFFVLRCNGREHQLFFVWPLITHVFFFFGGGVHKKEKQQPGCGSKFNRRGYFGTGFLSHSHLIKGNLFWCNDQVWRKWIWRLFLPWHLTLGGPSKRNLIQVPSQRRHVSGAKEAGTPSVGKRQSEPPNLWATGKRQSGRIGKAKRNGRLQPPMLGGSPQALRVLRATKLCGVPLTWDRMHYTRRKLFSSILRVQRKRVHVARNRN